VFLACPIDRPYSKVEVAAAAAVYVVVVVAAAVVVDPLLVASELLPNLLAVMDDDLLQPWEGLPSQHWFVVTVTISAPPLLA
jgi:hypothetical protein